MRPENRLSDIWSSVALRYGVSRAGSHLLEVYLKKVMCHYIAFPCGPYLTNVDLMLGHHLINIDSMPGVLGGAKPRNATNFGYTLFAKKIVK